MGQPGFITRDWERTMRTGVLRKLRIMLLLWLGTEGPDTLKLICFVKHAQYFIYYLSWIKINFNLYRLIERTRATIYWWTTQSKSLGSGSVTSSVSSIIWIFRVALFKTCIYGAAIDSPFLANFPACSPSSYACDLLKKVTTDPLADPRDSRVVPAHM